MNKKLKKIFIILLIISFTSIASAMSLFPNPSITQASFNYVFNFTQSEDCSNILLSYQDRLTTNDNGYAFADVDISSLNVVPYFLCEYKNGVLRKQHNFSDIVFNKIYVRNILSENITANNTNITNELNVLGEATFQDTVNIMSGVPTLIFDDTHAGHDKYRIRVNNDILKIGSGSPNIDYFLIEGNGNTNITMQNANVNILQNLTVGGLYLGNGSQLTGIIHTSANNDSFNQSLTDTLYQGLGINIFNQSLNTTDNIIFNNLNLTGYLTADTIFVNVLNITNSSFSFSDNENASIRYSVENKNSGTNASALITTLNNVGGIFGIGIGSSNYILGGIPMPNVTAIFSRSRGITAFFNFYNQPHIWKINPSDDGNPANLVEVMRLDENGLNVSGNINANNNLTVSDYFFLTNNYEIPPGPKQILRRNSATKAVFGVQNEIANASADSGAGYVLNTSVGEYRIDLHSALDTQNPNDTVHHLLGANNREIWRLNSNSDSSFRFESSLDKLLLRINRTGVEVNGTFNVIEDATFQNNVTILGTLFGGSPIKIGGGLNVTGNATANYFIGDGSLLTNLPSSNSNMLISNDGYKQVILTNTFLQYWDGTRNRIDITSVHTKFFSPGGSYTLLDNNQYVYNDGTRNRLEINNNGFMGVSPNGIETLIISNDGLLYNMVEIATVDDIYTDSDIDGTENAFSGWDKNSSDDFDGTWNSLSGIPSGFADGIDNESSGYSDRIVSSNGQALIIENDSLTYSMGSIRMWFSDAFTIFSSPIINSSIYLWNSSFSYVLNEISMIGANSNSAYLKSPDGINNISVNNSGTYIVGNFTVGDDRMGIDGIYTFMQSEQKNHYLSVGNDAVTVDGAQVFTASNTLSQISDVSPSSLDGQVLIWNETSSSWENRTLGINDNIPGTVVASVSWNANTVSSGEATLSYRKNHLKAFRLAPGIWSIENMGTNPLMPGDSADWIINSIGGGISNPFFLAETNIVAFGQPASGHPVTMEVSASSTSTSSNTGNLGSIIVKIKDKDGVVGDPTLADAYATIKFTYIV